MSELLQIHLYFGFLVVFSAIGLIWWYPLRRIMLYILTVQIILGAVLIYKGWPLVPLHIILGLGAWALYMVANGLRKRMPNSRVPLIVAVVASLLILITFGIGQHAVKAAHL